MMKMVPYKEIMNYVIVTDEMKQRILNNLKKVPFEESKRLHFKSFQKYCMVAACIALLITGGMAVWQYRDPVLPDSSFINQSVFQMEEVETVQELSKLVGFEISEPDIPFQVSEVRYSAIGRELAQIQYIGKEANATYRMMAGKEDPSGDFTEYQNMEEMTAEDVTFLLKGNESGYCLAIWQDERYSYSLRFSYELSKSQWEDILMGVSEF
ncbi:MAG: hypothetical protein ACOX6P_05505 [Candidatus Merdivicinus sp.]